jgi:hypothetical protein
VVARSGDHGGVAGKEFNTLGGVAYIDRSRTAWKGGGGSLKYASWPFADLAVNDTRIRITSPWGTVVVTRANLETIARYGRIPVFADGYRFVTDDHEHAVVFWAVRPNLVMNALDRHRWSFAD